MTAATLTKIVSIEFLVGMCLQAAVLLAVGYAWKATTDQDIKSLQEKAVVFSEDHDVLITLGANVASIKQTVDRIYSKLEQREVNRGNN